MATLTFNELFGWPIGLRDLQEILKSLNNALENTCEGVHLKIFEAF